MTSEIVPNFSEAPDPVRYEKSWRRIGRVARILWKLPVIGLERVPMEGPAILAFSHRSYTEIFLQGIVVRRSMRAMMKDEVKKYPILGKYLARRGIFYVHRPKPDPKTGAEAFSYLQQGFLLDMNPEGTSKNKGATLGELHPGVAILAVQAARAGIDCPIIPIAMASENLWLRPRSRIPTVIGYPIRVNLEGRTGKQAIEETHERLERQLQFVLSLAESIRK